MRKFRRSRRLRRYGRRRRVRVRSRRLFRRRRGFKRSGRRSRRLRSRSRINVGSKFERIAFRTNARIWPPSDGPTPTFYTKQNASTRSIAYSVYALAGTNYAERTPIQWDETGYPAASGFPVAPSDLVTKSSRYGVVTNYSWSLGDLSATELYQPFRRYSQYRIRRIRVYVVPRPVVRTTGGNTAFGNQTFSEAGDVAFMCTRSTKAIDDLVGDIAPIAGPGQLPTNRYSDLAYYQLVNRPDKAKRVVVRRNFATSGRPVVFKFTPTVNKDIIEWAELTSGGKQELTGGAGRVARVRAPWLPFYSFFQHAGSEHFHVYTDIRHYGLVIAMRPRSTTDGNFPLFDLRTFYDVEFRRPRVNGATQPSETLAKSFKMFADTLGDGQ